MPAKTVKVPADVVPEEPAKLDEEQWEEYAHRLERRIKEQREHITNMSKLRSNGNKRERKNYQILVNELGRATLLLGREREKSKGLIARLRTHEDTTRAVKK